MDLKLCNVEAFIVTPGATDQPNAALAVIASARRRWNEAHARFDIYRADQVRLTSTQFGGGDWHWRLTGASGEIVADCGGYRNEAQCHAAVSALRDEAGDADIFTASDGEMFSTNRA